MVVERRFINDNWKDTQQAGIQATGLAPPNDLESAIRIALQTGNYTAVLNAPIFATERANWRHCCNRQSKVVVRPLPDAGLADLTESDTQLSVFRALPANRLG
jgi:hypothetical protein